MGSEQVAVANSPANQADCQHIDISPNKNIADRSGIGAITFDSRHADGALVTIKPWDIKVWK